MKKTLTTLALFIFLLLSNGSLVLAVDTAMPIIDPKPTTNPITDIFGQDHYYTITLRGNGELAVSGRMLFSNTGELPLTTYNLKVPSGKLHDLIIYQVSREPICEQYDPYPVYQPETKANPQESMNLKRYPQPRCITYRQPAYYDYLYGQNTYSKAEFTYANDEIHVNLPKAVVQGGSSGLLVFYRSDSFTKRTLLGGYTYEFKTLKTDTTIHTLQIGISPDSELVVKGAKGKVQYSQPQYMDSAIMKNSAAGVSAPQLDTYYQQIGQGTEVKTSQDLQPLDTYTVKGEYADSVWKLYGNEIVIGLIILSVCLGLLIMIIKKIGKSTGQLSNQNKSIFLVVAVSVITSMFIAGYTVFVYVISTLIQSSYYSQFNTIVTILLLVISCGIYLILLVGPALWIGLTKGIRYGVSTCILTVFLLGVTLVILIASIFIT